MTSTSSSFSRKSGWGLSVSQEPSFLIYSRAVLGGISDSTSTLTVISLSCSQRRSKIKILKGGFPLAGTGTSSGRRLDSVTMMYDGFILRLDIVRCCSMAAIIAPSYFQTPCSGGFFIFRSWKPPVPMAPISNRCLPIPWANRGNAPDRVVFFSPYGPFMEKSAFVCRKSRNPRVETPPQWA